jgi:hypothetical protein
MLEVFPARVLGNYQEDRDAAPAVEGADAIH